MNMNRLLGATLIGIFAFTVVVLVYFAVLVFPQELQAGLLIAFLIGFGAYVLDSARERFTKK